MTLLRSDWHWKHVLLGNLAIVAVYVSMRGLSQFLALPPGYATPLFPPAGVGLALVVSGGWRMLPGIALGSLLLHLPTGWIGPGAAPAPAAAMANVIVTLGSLLQAWIGARLFRRWIHPAIGSGRDALRFLLLVAGICLINASITVPSLYWLGLLPETERLSSWLSWWTGDTTGVLLAAPLTWIACGQPRQLWRRRVGLVAVPLLLAAAAVVATYGQAVKWERSQQLEAFRRSAQQVGDTLQARLSEHERFAHALGRTLGQSREELPQREFLNIAQAYLAKRSELVTVDWAVRVAAENRAAFEAWARRTVDPGFEIRDVGPARTLRRAAERGEYFALLYSAPQRDGKPIGLDLAAAPMTAAAVRQVLQTRLPVASAPFSLLSSGRMGVGLFGAVGPEQPAPAARAGILGLVLDVESHLDAAVQRVGFGGFAVAVTDVSDRLAPRPMLDTIRRAPRAGEFHRLLTFGGRSYELRFAATAAAQRQHIGWASWSVLTAGLVMTGLLGSLMLLISGERAQIKALVTQRTAQLRDREARLEAILDNVADAIVTVDEQGLLVSANLATEQLFHYPPDSIAGLSFDSLVPAAADESAPQLLRRLAATPVEERAVTGLASDGAAFPVEISVSTVTLPHEQLFVCILRDLTEQYRAQAHIYQLAHHDVLTGLENRFALNLRLEQQLSQARRSGQLLAVLFIDLDHFKKINDSHGHQAGDQLLVAAAQRMRDLLRDCDALARLGGDEFVILLGGELTPDRASHVAVRVLEALSQPYLLAGRSAHSGASVGVALFPADGDDGGTLLRHADTAMYAAKRGGRNNFQFFSAAMNAATHEHLMLENRMWLALEHNLFQIHLQAQVKLDSGRVIGAEVLLRWHDAELGNIEPSRFIPIAEECGLILPLGDWVLATTMQLLADWQRDRRADLHGLRLAVNLSARQFSGGALVARLDQLMAQHHINPALLELEITETAAMQDPENTRFLLRQLRERGYKVAIDDFGTGYSSLSYLKLFAIDRIKIDRGFVKDIETNPNDAVIVAATIGLAHSLGLTVVAEGVETLAQWGFLRDKHGDEAQGYLFARPMPAAQFLDFIGAQVQPVFGP